MLYIILFVIIIIAGGYFVFCYFSIIYAIKKITEDINDIQQDLTRNQMLHLPIPNRHLKNLLCEFNSALEEIQKERQKYERREKEFQKQIENISHDLRTPLTVILGYLKLFRRSHKEQLSHNRELEETIDTVEHKAEIMKNLVEEFYNYSRLNGNDYKLLLGKVDVSRILKESLMGNCQILEQACLKVEIDIPEHPVWGIGEESALERIFFNLFQNAGRYADTTFRIEVKEYKEKISILFTNDTRVLSAEDVPHLFDRFYMQDNSRKQGGTGLGLTVAKSLAERMGATLEAKIMDKDSGQSRGIICFEMNMKCI